MTEEPFRLDPQLVGLPLASFRRRIAAWVIDAALWLATGVPLLILLGLGALWVQAPDAFQGLQRVLTRRSVDDETGRAMYGAFLDLVDRRRPDLLPATLTGALRAGDVDRAIAYVDSVGVSFTVDLSGRDPSSYDATMRRIYVRNDILFGRLASFVGVLSFGLLYHTLLGAIGRGRTPGKWLFGCRIVRLDGARFGVGTAFDRAGGYTASFSTLGLGFAQALRDPNRQTLHDRMAGTVVVRAPRRRGLRSGAPPVV